MRSFFHEMRLLLSKCMSDGAGRRYSFFSFFPFLFFLTSGGPFFRSFVVVAVLMEGFLWWDYMVRGKYLFEGGGGLGVEC